jgi:hypothetical protein
MAMITPPQGSLPADVGTSPGLLDADGASTLTAEVRSRSMLRRGWEVFAEASPDRTARLFPVMNGNDVGLHGVVGGGRWIAGGHDPFEERSDGCLAVVTAGAQDDGTFLV